MRLEFKISLPYRQCSLSKTERSMLAVEIRNEKTMQTDRCVNIVLYQNLSGDCTIQVALLPSIATSDWKYYLVLPPLSMCQPDTQFTVSVSYRYLYKYHSNRVNSHALPKTIPFGQLPQSYIDPQRVQGPTVPRIPYQEEDLDQLTDVRINVPGKAVQNTFSLGFEGVFPTQTYTRGSMIHLGSMSEITNQRNKRNTIKVEVRVQVIDVRETTKSFFTMLSVLWQEADVVEVESLSDIRVLAYEWFGDEKAKVLRLPDEDWAIKSFSGIVLRADGTGGVVLTKTLTTDTPNAHYWLRLPPLPHGYEYHVTNSLSYIPYVGGSVDSNYWICEDS